MTRCALISGITGHLGQEVARQLSAAGLKVHGLTRRRIASIPECNTKASLHYIAGHTSELVTLLEELRPDVIFHLASYYRREHQSADIEPMVQSNVQFGSQLLEAARLAGCTRFITAGSYFQHFNTSNYRPLNLYAATKRAFDDLLTFYIDAHGFQAVSLFLYEIYSETDTRPKLMTAVARGCFEGIPLRLPDQEVFVDLVHVEDAASAFLQADSLSEGNLLRRDVLSEYSVCSGRDTTPGELVALFERLSKREIPVLRDKYPHPERAMNRPWRGSVLPGWTPRVTLEEGVSRILTSQRWSSHGTA